MTKPKNTIKPNEWWAIQKFGNLRLKNAIDISPNSRYKMEFVCGCGRSKFIIVKSVTSGITKSCGNCPSESESKPSVSKNTKSEIQAKIDELKMLSYVKMQPETMVHVNSRISKLEQEMNTADEDIISAAVSSHHVMCEVKNMRPDEAFGSDPFVYYALGLVGEAGELTGALLRAIRNGDTISGKKAAVESELADCIIYAVILAYATGIDLTKIVNEKARIVESRARSGYYGPPIR